MNRISDACRWEPVDTIQLPPIVQFLDYSAVSIYRYRTPNYIAVTSQENSQVWIGTIAEHTSTPYFEVSTLNMVFTNIYDTPRIADDKNQCQVQYCNVEGVAWQNETHLILVSDKAKKTQSSMCLAKHQQIHYFSLPTNSID
jgi:hypothetical protein